MPTFGVYDMPAVVGVHPCHNLALLITFCDPSVCYKDLSNTWQPGHPTLLFELVQYQMESQTF